MVGGPRNMAVYRHILVVPPTAKVLPPKNDKPHTAKTLPPYCIIAEKIPPYFGFTASAKKVPTLDTAKKYRQLPIPPKEYRQLSIPPKRYRHHGIAPKRYRRHWISPKGTADTGYHRKGTTYTGYRPKSPAFLSVFVLCYCSFWFFGFLSGSISS